MPIEMLAKNPSEGFEPNGYDLAIATSHPLARSHHHFLLPHSKDSPLYPVFCAPKMPSLTLRTIPSRLVLYGNYIDSYSHRISICAPVAR